MKQSYILEKLNRPFDSNVPVFRGQENAILNFTECLTLGIKPWSNGLASNRKWVQVELAYRLALGGQTDSKVSSQVHVSRKKNHFKADISCVLLANNRLMDVTQLALTWVGWPNGGKLALTCDKFDLDQSERKSSQVHASAHKPWPNGVASRPKFSTYVYLRVRLARA